MHKRGRLCYGVRGVGGVGGAGGTGRSSGRADAQVAEPDFFAVVLQAEKAFRQAAFQLGKGRFVGGDDHHAVVNHMVLRAEAVDLQRVPLADFTAHVLRRRGDRVQAARVLIRLELAVPPGLSSST